jgi:hypothetical protein
MRSWIIFLQILVLLGLTLELQAQEDNDFIISVQHNENQIILHCVKGCNWERLSFTKPDPNSPQVIDRSGMVAEKELEQVSNHPYYFTIYEKDNVIYLTGGDGNDFLETSFSLYQNDVQWINQNGMKTSRDEE